MLWEFPGPSLRLIPRKFCPPRPGGTVSRSFVKPGFKVSSNRRFDSVWSVNCHKIVFVEVPRFIGKANFPKTINPPAGGNYFQISVKFLLRPFVKNLALTGTGRYGVPKKPLWERSGYHPKFGFAQKPKSTRRGELLFGRLGFASRIPWSPPPGGNGSPKILGSVPTIASGPVRVYARGPRVGSFPDRVAKGLIFTA